MKIRMLSWNVNGLRAVSAKPEWTWFTNSEADIVALQETKAAPEQLSPDLRAPFGLHAAWTASTVKKGYSGVAVFSRREPLSIRAELPDPAFQGEGRLLHLEYPEFHFFAVYFPNGGEENKRVPYKMGFYDAFLRHAQDLRRTKPLVVCGDFNTAHREIDLAHPRQNETKTGFLPEERAWMDAFVAAGYVDTFRHVHGDVTGAYTWWSYRMGARRKNVGWRIDYFFVSRELLPAVRNAWIEKDVHGSDHCPLGLELEL
ncbi:MAG: exodeoxyribonuclease III [Deltaproteobacteria bacterium]|jgi:exodeoxyribonuclease-3|nr:exodeoxyribonuclease III [Deltaproteobacteria bacterium]